MTCIVEDDVDATKLLLGVFEGGIDVTFVHDVEFKDVEPVGGVFDLEVVQDRRFTKSSDRDVSIVQDGFGH